MQQRYLRGWTAGRTVRAPVILRRPARYENDGLPDQERALARRGVALVGAVKSAALVEVVARGGWWEEAAARVRAAHARRDRAASRPARRALVCHRHGDPDRRPRRPGSRDSSGACRKPARITSSPSPAATSRSSSAWCSDRSPGWACADGWRRPRRCSCSRCIRSIAGGGASVARASLTAGIYLAVRLIDQRTAAANAVAVTAAAPPAGVAARGCRRRLLAHLRRDGRDSRRRRPDSDACIRAGADALLRCSRPRARSSSRSRR